MFLEVEIFSFHHGFVEFSGTLQFFCRLKLSQGQAYSSNAIATRISLYILVPRSGKVAFYFTFFDFSPSILSFVRIADPQLVCSYLEEEQNSYSIGHCTQATEDLFVVHRVDQISIQQELFSRSYCSEMATFDLTDPKVMTVRRGGTTQVLLFSDALKNSSNSADGENTKCD